MKIILTSDTHYGFSQNTHSIHEKFWKKVSDAKPNVLLHAGDIASSRQDQFHKSLSMMRDALPDIPIVIVRGNHDLWERDKYHRRMLGYDWDRLYQQQEHWLRDLKIVHASQELFIYEDEGEGLPILFTGFDGWYHNPTPGTNDRARMLSEFWEGEDIFKRLSREAHLEVDQLLLEDLVEYRKSVCMTHFPPFTQDEAYSEHCANPAYYPLLTEKFDVLCVGHSHQRVDRMEGKCRVLNAGSDYDEPNFIEFQL